MKTIATLLTVLLAAPLSLATLHATEVNAAEHKTAPASEMTDGEVRRVDKDANKLTLRHGRIENLGMPPMTMVFQVKDAALLDKVKVGDKVKFHAEKISGGYAVTHVEVAQ
jgi:Cu(I)/Ag(I) efflux system periplasmic protein CusF